MKKQHTQKNRLNSAISFKKEKDFLKKKTLRAKYSKLAKLFRVHFFHQKYH